MQTSSRISESRRCRRKNSVRCWLTHTGSYARICYTRSSISTPDGENPKCLCGWSYSGERRYSWLLWLPDTFCVYTSANSRSCSTTISNTARYESRSPRFDTESGGLGSSWWMVILGLSFCISFICRRTHSYSGYLLYSTSINLVIISAVLVTSL